MCLTLNAFPSLLTDIDSNGRGLLQHAMRAGTHERQYTVMFALLCGWPGAWPLQPDSFGRSPLHVALLKLDPTACQLMLDFVAALRELGIELMEDDALILDEALRNGSTTPGSYKLKGGGSVEADVLLPAFGTRQSGFLADLRGVLDPQGNVVVNEYMQCPAAPRLFAVGCTNLPEFAGMPKIESQAKTAVANLKLCLQGKTCAQKHKEGAPFMKAPPMTIVGHDTFAFMDTTNMPPPVACCAWVGFPCCPPPVCWCCLGPFCCGGPCQDPEGRPLALFTKMMAHKSAEMGGKLKGMGQLPETASTTTVGSAPPAQQQMS
jgi:hypothetical protein